MGQISDLICGVLGQQNSGPLRRTARKTQPQPDEQRGKRACALTARGSISKAAKGLVCGAAQGSADCRRNWTTALIPSLQCGVRRGGANCLGRRKVQNGTKRDERAGLNLNRCRFTAALPPMSAPGPLVNGRNTWNLSSPSQEPARGDVCSGGRHSYDQVGNRRLAG